MFTPSPIELLSIVIFKDKIEDVIAHLIKLGIFQPVDIQELEPQPRISTLITAGENTAWVELETKLKEICRKLCVPLTPVKEIKRLEAENIKDSFKQIEDKVNRLLTDKEKFLSELKRDEAIFSRIEDYFLFPIKKTTPYSFLEIAIGTIEEKNIQVLERSLKDIPYLFYPLAKVQKSRLSALIIGLKRDRAVLDRILIDLGWQEIEFPTSQHLSTEASSQLRARIEECKNKISELNAQIKKLADDFSANVGLIYSAIMLNQSLLKAKKYSYTTDKTAILSGWVLAEDKSRVINEIKKVAGTSYIEHKPAEELAVKKEEIPVRLKHNVIFKPFELLINSYGVPRYATIDPTMFVAISFLIMFGAMFGDLGQGLVLVLAGLIFMRSKKEIFKQAFTLLFYCGLSSCVFGVLYGSFFGFEEVIAARWMKPMSNVLELFKISVTFGIIIITLGIAINIINALKDKNYLKALFDKSGLLTGMIYWLAIALITKSLTANISVKPVYLYLIACGFAAMFLKPLIEAALKNKKAKNAAAGTHKESIFASCLESLIDILEIIMGYLANTVSFIRIAAFSLAHAGLFFAVFKLSEILKGVAANSLSILIIILGNILIILLEGMVVTIQSLRLNYYEFFSKFFVSGKQVFKPLTIESR